LRSALGDPSLELVAWEPTEHAYVGEAGRRLALPISEPGRAVTLVEQDGVPLAALVHDEALLEDPGLVSAVAAAVRLTADNERLRGELQRSSPRWRRPGPASWPRVMRNGAGSSATCTTGHSSAWSPSRSRCGSRKLGWVPGADPATREAVDPGGEGPQ
jgi:hypothetical protein